MVAAVSPAVPVPGVNAEAWCRGASSRAQLRASQFPADQQTLWCVMSEVYWLYAAWRSIKVDLVTLQSWWVLPSALQEVCIGCICIWSM